MFIVKSRPFKYYSYMRKPELSMSVLFLAICALLSCSHADDEKDVVPTSLPKLYVHYGVMSSRLPNGSRCADIYINQHLNDSTDYGMRFCNKENTLNRNFDFYQLYLLDGGKPKPSDCHSVNSDAYHFMAGHETDYIVAMQLYAAHNADGDFPDATTLFTGGFHGYNSETSGNFTPTMYEVGKAVYADGKPIAPNTSVYCDSVRVVVENMLQGANTEKADGSGRYILKQTITLTCKGGDYNIEVGLTPVEDIYFRQVNGLCFYNNFDKISFIGSKTHTGTYGKKQVTRADKCVTSIRQSNGDYFFDVFMDPEYGIGNQQYNDDQFNASIESASKSYFQLIYRNNGLLVPSGKSLHFRGGYRFGSSR